MFILFFTSGLSPTTLQALAKLVNARTVNTALVSLVSLWNIYVTSSLSNSYSVN